MGVRAALISGTALSLAAVTAWSCMANLAVGAPAPLHLTRDLPGDYVQLAAAPAGNPLALFAVVAVIYTLCFLASGLRARSRALRDARESHTEDMEAVPVSGRRS